MKTHNVAWLLLGSFGSDHCSLQTSMLSQGTGLLNSCTDLWIWCFLPCPLLLRAALFPTVTLPLTKNTVAPRPPFFKVEVKYSPWEEPAYLPLMLLWNHTGSSSLFFWTVKQVEEKKVMEWKEDVKSRWCKEEFLCHEKGFTVTVMTWIVAYTPHSCVEALTSIVTVFGNGALEYYVDEVMG